MGSTVAAVTFVLVFMPGPLAVGGLCVMHTHGPEYITKLIALRILFEIIYSFKTASHIVLIRKLKPLLLLILPSKSSTDFVKYILLCCFKYHFNLLK